MITKEQAVAATYHQEFYFWLRGRVQRVRVSGKCKTWKRAPERFRLPIKYGLYENGAIGTEDDCSLPETFFMSEEECALSHVSNAS